VSRFEPGLPSISQVLLGEVAAEIVVGVRRPDCRAAAGKPELIGDQPAGARRVLRSASIPARDKVGCGRQSGYQSSNCARRDDNHHDQRNAREQTPQPLIRITPRGEKIRSPAISPIRRALRSARTGSFTFRAAMTHGAAIHRLRGPGNRRRGPCVACGIAFDSEGTLFVGDRSGRVYAVNVETGVKRDLHSSNRVFRIPSGFRRSRSSIRDRANFFHARFAGSHRSERRY